MHACKYERLIYKALVLHPANELMIMIFLVANSNHNLALFRASKIPKLTDIGKSDKNE